MFVSIEGIDGSGKTTVLNVIKDLLIDIPVKFIKQPIDEIRKIFIHSQLDGETEALLIAASLRMTIPEIFSAFNHNQVVISDRFHHSLLVYQGYGRGISIQWLKSLLPDIKPDFTILIDCSPEIALRRIISRGEPDRVEREGIEFYTRVQKGFLNIAEEEKEKFVIIDGSRDLTNVLNDVKTVVQMYKENSYGYIK